MNDRLKLDMLRKGFVTKDDVRWFLAEDCREQLILKNSLGNAWHGPGRRRGRNEESGK